MRWPAGLTAGGFVIAFAVGAVSLGGLGTGLQWTNTQEFCISCHEMAENAYAEYQQTVHFRNVSGVRATCSDCHVPKDWRHKLAAKVRASKDVYHHLLGTIDTPDKYEAHRLRMAEAVWSGMKSNDSRECRSCHDFDAMALDEQQGRARRKHEQIAEKGQTCIDCHKGLAHELPAGFTDNEYE